MAPAGPAVARVGPSAAVLAGGRAAAAGHRSALRAIATALLLSATTPAAAHPFDALSGPEIEAAALPRADGHLGQDGRVASITLVDPAEDVVLARREGAALPRRAAVEAVVDLDARRVERWTPVPGKRPSFLLAGSFGAVDVVTDAGWRAARGKRGYTDFAHIPCNPPAAGHVAEPGLAAGWPMNVPCFDAEGARKTPSRGP